MADNTLRSFLVKLGFQVDKKSKKDFESSVQQATLHVRELSAAVGAAVVGVGAGVTKMAYSLNQLHFEARRTGSSAKHLKAFGYAASQLGSSSQQAQGAVEGLASKLRQHPGTENLLNRIGVQTRDAHGHLRGTANMLEQFGHRAQHMRMYQAEAYAQALGIPENLLLALRRGKFDHFFKQYEHLAKNSDINKAVEQSHHFTVQLNQMAAQFQLLGVRSEAALEKTIGPSLKKFAQWMQKNGPQIAKEIGHWGHRLITFGKDAVKWFDKVNNATDGWLGTIVKTAAELKALSKLAELAGLSQLIRVFGGVAKGTAKVGKKLAGGTAGDSAAASGGETAASGAATADAAAGAGLFGLGDILAGAPLALYPSKITGSTLGADSLKQAHKAGQEWARKNSLIRHDNRNQSSVDNRNQGAINTDNRDQSTTINNTRNQHVTKAENREHLVKLFLQNKTKFSKAGRAGILANLQAEDSTFDPHQKQVGGGHGYGIAQWGKARQKDFKKLFGHSMQSSNLFEQLMFMQHELGEGKYKNLSATLRHHGHGYNAGYDFSKEYERPGAGTGAAVERARSAQHIYNHTTINVQGTHDPQAVANRVSAAQNDQNRAAVRNQRTPAK